MSALKTTIEWQEGYVIPSTLAGQGVELDYKVIKTNPYTDNKHHLNLSTDPVLPYLLRAAFVRLIRPFEFLEDVIESNKLGRRVVLSVCS